MRGYLKHIAARASGTAAVVRPRVPSTFEPVKGAGVVGAGESTVRETEVESAAPVPVAREMAAIERPVVRDPMAALTQWIERGNQERPAAETARESVRTEDFERKTAPVAEKASFWPASLNRVDPSDWKAPAIEVKTEIPEARRSETQKQATPVTREVERPVVPRAVEKEPAAVERRETTRIEREHVVERVRAAVEREGGVRPVGLVSQTTLKHVGEPVPPRQVVQEPRGDEAAGVQVTIGRVIVEAVMPQAAPPPVPVRQMPGPRLSLEEYLRQRGGRA